MAQAVITQRTSTGKSERLPTTAPKPAEPGKKRATSSSRARAKTKKG
jgi:hypothetical protein